MTASTLSLTDFLLARIAEDEAAVEVRATIGVDYWTDAEQEAVERVGSERVLAECDAKRRIVEAEPDCGFDRFQRVAWDDCHEAALRALALPYADHPDYREEWRP